MKDLLVLCADQDAEFVLKALMNRIPSVENLQQISYEIIRHPQRDPGVANKSIEFVRPYINDYKFLLITFDHEGSGKESQKRDDIENDIMRDLSKNGWDGRNACIIFEPELESWLWVNYVHLHSVTDWHHASDIYSWIVSKGFQVQTRANKPLRPKEAFEAILRKQNIPRSSSLYFKLAQNAGYEQCVDLSFNKFLATMRTWFPVGDKKFSNV